DVESQVDDVVVVEGRRLDVRLRLVLDLAAQEALRERRPVVGRAVVGGEDRDEVLPARLPVLHRKARRGEAPSDDDDLSGHPWLLPSPGVLVPGLPASGDNEPPPWFRPAWRLPPEPV